MAVLTGLPKSRLGLACIVAFAVFVSVGSARWLGWLEVPEFALYDRDLRAASEQEIAEPPITLVKIDENDIRRHGHPLRDETLRRLIETVLIADPRVLAIDLHRVFWKAKGRWVSPISRSIPTASSAAGYSICGTATS
jgi:CHASE2 domain-containing sensor protein